jgi:hypothetical protein
VLAAPETQEFLRRTGDLLEFVLPKYEREGKSYLTIAIGCTGGRHRSVVIADALARALSDSVGATIAVLHRDVRRGDAAPRDAVVERRLQPPLDADDTHDERSSALELKGASTPPPTTAGTRGGRS